MAGRWPQWRSPTVDEKMKVTGHVGPLDDKVSELQRNFSSTRTKPNKPSRRGIHSDVEKAPAKSKDAWKLAKLCTSLV